MAPVEVLPEGQATEDGESSSSVDKVVAQVDERSGPGPGSGPKGWSKGEMERPRQNSNKGWFARMLCCLMPRAQRGGYDDWNNGNGDDTEFNRDATEAELGGHRALDADGKPQPHIAVAVAPQAPIRDLINSPRSHAEARGMRDFSADDDRDLEAPAPPPASANPIIYSVDVAPGRARLVFTASSSTPAGSAGWIPRGVPIPSEGERWAGYPNCVIGPAHEMDRKKKTLVLDLDETLVHSSFKPVADADYIIPVDIDGRVLDVYVLKRPHLDEFLRHVGAKFEVVVFTASLAKYADPLLDLLDVSKVVRWRLFREACQPFEGNYVKNLLCLGRELSKTIIVDNSPHSYIFQPENAVPISTFIDDMGDQDLLSLLECLDVLADCDDVRNGIAGMGIQPFPDDFM